MSLPVWLDSMFFVVLTGPGDILGVMKNGIVRTSSRSLISRRTRSNVEVLSGFPPLC